MRVRDDVGPSLPALHSLQGLSCECNEQKCQVSGRDNSPAKGLHGAFDIRKRFEIILIIKVFPLYIACNINFSGYMDKLVPNPD